MVSSTLGGSTWTGLEPAIKRGVLFDMLAILIESRRGRWRAASPRASCGFMMLPASAAPSAAPRAHQRATINKQQNSPFTGSDFLQERLQPVFKLAAVLGPGDHRPKVHRHQPLVF